MAKFTQCQSRRHAFVLLPHAVITLLVGPVPARYVRHSQMSPQLDVSDTNEQRTQDMSEKARYVRQQLCCVLLAFY